MAIGGIKGLSALYFGGDPLEQLGWYSLIGLIAGLLLWRFNEADYNSPPNDAVSIMLMSIAAAVLYGITQDQFTVRISEEYFTIAHPPMVQTDSPTLLALFWGTTGTFWVGIAFGIPLAYITSFGESRPIPARILLKPFLVLLITMGTIATAAGWWASDFVSINPPLWTHPGIADDRLDEFFVVSCIHCAAYLSGLIGSVALWRYAWLKRRKLQKPE